MNNTFFESTMISKEFIERDTWERVGKPIPLEIPDELLERLGMKKPIVPLTRQERRKLKRNQEKKRD